MMLSTLSLREKRALGLVVILCIVLRISLAFRPEVQIYSRYFQEDAFYLFTCAEHLAHGEGFSVDGIHPTNGVQPLIVVAYAPLFILTGFDKLLTLKLAFVYTALFDALSIVFLVLLLKTLRKKKENETEAPLWYSPYVIAALLWATLFPIFVHTVSGLETGLSSMLMIASLWHYAVILKRRKEGTQIHLRRYIALGILLGFTVLARIDAVFFVGMIALYELITQRRRGVLPASIIAVIAFIVSLPWWYYNYTVFGNLIPQSGLSLSSFDRDISRNVWQTISVIADSLSVFFSLTKMIAIPVIFYIIWFVGVVGGVVILFRKWKLFSYIKKEYSIEVLIPLILASGILVIYYVFFFNAPHFISRYLQPLRIITLVIAAMVIPVIIRQALLSRVTQVILFVFIFAALANSALRYIPNFTTTEVSDFYTVGKWALTLPSAKVGMYQSGTAGFIASNVVNLDGKVNYAALAARKNGDIGQYVIDEHIEYIADWKPLAEEIVHSTEKHGAVFQLMDSIKGTFIYKRIL